ncbi:MAG: beta-ketoacyl-ACP synthase III [Methylocystaceae bacterium]
MSVAITGWGCEVPPHILDNAQLETMVDTTDEWILTRTGIRERRILDPALPVSALAIPAARQAIARAGIEPADIDLIIVATVTPDMIFPATACIVQAELGADRAAAFDLEAGCTGFIYGLSVAEKFLQAPGFKHALVIGAEVLSRIVDYSDRSTCVLFGDGAGAVVLSQGDYQYGLLATALGSDGHGRDLLYAKAGGSLLPTSHDTVAAGEHYLRMNGNEVFRWASRILPEVAARVLQQAGYDWSDVDLLIPHQANKRIITTAAKRMGIPEDKIMINLDRYGNMSSASIPVALVEALNTGRISDGSLVLMVGFGAGLTYGGALVRWGGGCNEL